MPEATEISEDFPDPEGPTTATLSPGIALKLTPFNISTGPDDAGRVR